MHNHQIFVAAWRSSQVGKGAMHTCAGPALQKTCTQRSSGILPGLALLMIMQGHYHGHNVQEGASRMAELEAQTRKMAQELAEYKSESTELRNQDHTVRRLEERVRSLEAELGEKVGMD